MEETISLQKYLTSGVENIVKNAVYTSLTNPVQSIFMAGFAKSVKVASEKRFELKKAGSRQNILFPIFTNGTLVDDTYIKLLKKSRNLIPIFSIEGKEKKTDARRGEGVFEKVLSTMGAMQKEKLMFGSSVTVTKDNMEEVMSDTFIQKL